MRQQDEKNDEKNGNDLTRKFTRTLTSEGKEFLMFMFISYLAMLNLYVNSCTDVKFFSEVSEGEDDYGDFNDDRGVDTDAHGQLLDKIDAYSFRIFPFVFLVTNIPFWCYYIIFSPANCS